MNDIRNPAPHPDPWVDLLRDYVTASVRALASGDLRVQESWLDPCGPRDATILYSSPLAAETYALVWDEETGWRSGRYVSGRQGVRTRLTDVRYVGGGVLIDPRGLRRRVEAGEYAPPRRYRSHTDLRDGLDDLLPVAGRSSAN